MAQRMIQLLTVGFLLISMLPFARGQEAFVLDCPVARASPLFDIAEFAEGKAMVLLDRYRFLITRGSKTAFATTPRGSNIPAQFIESDTQYQLYFENKYVAIDRMTTEFQVGVAGASAFFGSGTCTKLGEQKF